MIKTDLSNHDGFFFVHIPKTAGTTFNSILEKRFGEEHIYPHKKEFANYGKFKLLETLPEKRVSQLKLIRGHFKFNAADPIFKNPILLTILRDPIARIISAIFHHKYNVNRIKGNFRTDDLIKLYRNNRKRFKNQQMSFFVESKENIEYNETHLEEAKQKLKEFHFIGMTEEFGKSMELLSYQFDWEKIEIGERLNVSKKEKKYPEELESIIRSENKLDIEFYEFAYQVFNNRISKII